MLLNSAEDELIKRIHGVLGSVEHLSYENIPSIEISDNDKLCKKPLVSIVSITYNHEKYIEKMFLGIESQVCDFDFELIIGEDCSLDNTRNLCLEFQKKHPEYVRIITSDNNVGAKCNSKRCQQKVRGDYIAFCEGDDFWVDNLKLQKQVDFLEGNKDFGIIHTGCVIINPHKRGKNKYFNDSQYSKICLKKTENQVQDFLLGRWGVATASVMMRRNLREKIMNSEFKSFFNEKHRMGDFQLWTAAMFFSKMGYIADVTTAYVLSKESASRPKNMYSLLEFFCDACVVNLRCNELFNNNKYSTRQTIIKRFCFQLLFVSYQGKFTEILCDIITYFKSKGEYKKNTIVQFAHYCYLLKMPYWVFSSMVKFCLCFNKFKKNNNEST